MKIEFLGHGLHGSYRNTVGDWIKSTFNDPDYFSFVGFSAFTKMSGIELIKKELLVAKQEYQSIKFYLGIVEKGTSKEALEFFIKNGIETWVYCTNDTQMFHPKIYYFQGKHNSRFIIGSSNLTKAGLFENIEASTLFEFSNKDLSGKKFINQYQSYFSSVLNGTEINTQLLTSEVLDDLIESGFVYDELKTNEEFDFAKRNKHLGERRTKRKFEKSNIGDQKGLAKQLINPISGNSIPPITQEYLDSWFSYFELFKEFKKENSHKGERFSVTIPRDYKNASLYGWYRRQKIYFKNNMLPDEHKKLLDSEKFYFKDAHKLWQEYLQEQKLVVLVEALIDGEDIRVNHRYEYKGIRLGTWLVEVSQANKKGKKLELRQQILDLGFDISSTGRNPVDSANRFLNDLLEAENPDKMRFQSRFNGTIRDRINEIPDDILQYIVDAWHMQFNETRVLGKIREKVKDRTDEWKSFRYNEELNPEHKWLSTFNKMGSVYYWARLKREHKSQMDLISKQFTDKEKEELRIEYFPV
jgi:HKD family nuclease